MKFAPKTEQQLEQERKEAEQNRLMPFGTICDFEIVNADDKVSSAGNDMIKLAVKVFKPSGEEQIVDDFLLESMEYKLRHAASACGLIDKYSAGELHAYDFPGKTGKCKMGIKRDKTGQYPPKNVINNYIKRPDNESGAAPAKTAADLDDEIPF